jgi:TonB-linked SusC/RagA family outer membrane protein
MRKIFMILGMCFALLGNAMAQQKVTGTVTGEDGLAIPGVSIVQKGTTNGTVSDIDGNYAITVPGDAVLVFSFVGLKSQEISVNGQQTILVTLAQENTGLDEVVVVGYGTQKKVNLTGAVAQVQMDEVLGDRPVTSVASALQGTIPGLQVTGGAEPGNSKVLNIRGITSISALGSSPSTSGEPLVLIDNVPGDIDLINPEDIESISVLKDAASAAIYGARGAFGVILITTKKAKSQKMILNYSNSFAFQYAINRPQQVSVKDYLNTFKDFASDGSIYGNNIDEWIGYLDEYNSDPAAFAANHNGNGEYFENGRYLPAGYTKNYFYLKDNDPQSAIIDDYGIQQTHNISATGGSESLTYRMAMGYTDQNGPLITDKDAYNRINISSYVKADLTKWLSQSVDVFLTKSDQSRVENESVFQKSHPMITPSGSMPSAQDAAAFAAGTLSMDDLTYYPVFTPANFLMYADPSKWLTEDTRVFSRTSIHPIKGLEGVFEYTYDTKHLDYKRFTNNETMITISNQLDGISGDPRYYNTKRSTALNSLNAYATYEWNMENHAFKFMGGYSQETRDYESLAINRNQMINNDRPSLSSATGVINGTDTYTQYAIRSAFFRLNYNYKDKYLLEVNGRYDGSSKFPSEQRFGFFPSVSAGWRLDKEGFMDWSDSWLDLAKFRFSYGELGNQDGVMDYGFMPTMYAGLSNWIVDGILPITLNPPALVRTDYTWEVVQTTDIGVDLAMLNQRLTATYDWYKRNTIGMLAPGVQLPAVVGANAPEQNAADLQTKGWEFSVQWKDRIGDWRYGLGFNLYDSKTVITKYDNVAGLFYDAATNSNYREGMEIGEIWGRVTDGFYTAADFDATQLAAGKFILNDGVVTVNGANVKPGDIKFVDLDPDGEINDGEGTVFAPGDRKIIGNSTPRYQYGINANVGWKGFDLSVLLQGVGKRDAWMSGEIFFPPGLNYIGVYENTLNYWKPVDLANNDFTAANPDAYFPRIYNDNENKGSNYSVQTKYLQDASYLRVKNITLGYTFPKEVVNRVGLTAGKVFFSGENLFTFDHLNPGIDPERLGWGYPFYATYSFGINLTL